MTYQLLPAVTLQLLKVQYVKQQAAIYGQHGWLKKDALRNLNSHAFHLQLMPSLIYSSLLLTQSERMASLSFNGVTLIV